MSAQDEIELYLCDRLRQRVHFKTGTGYREGHLIKPTTVHQELRVLRRILNVAVRKGLLTSNPCARVEFPVTLKGLFRPHYVTWSEQQKIENHAVPHLRNAIRIIAETGAASGEGIASDEERPTRFSKRGSLDTRFEDTKRCRGDPADETGIEGC